MAPSNPRSASHNVRKAADSSAKDRAMAEEARQPRQDGPATVAKEASQQPPRSVPDRDIGQAGLTTVVVTLYPEDCNRYSAQLNGEVIVSNSRDPEHDIARALLARGLTGRALIVDGHTGARRIWVNIEKAALWRMVEESRGGLRRRRWSESKNLGESDDPPAEDDLATSTEDSAYGVRESHEQAGSSIPRQATPSPAAHDPDRLLIQLSTEWRVVDDDLQYILQRRRDIARSKASGWVGRSFCRTCQALLRCIREYCGPLDDDALQQVRDLPEWHVDRC
jgi:hypothetical protein